MQTRRDLTAGKLRSPQVTVKVQHAFSQRRLAPFYEHSDKCQDVDVIAAMTSALAFDPGD